MVKNFREAVNESSTPWTDEEQRIAVELMKSLVGGTPSKVLVRKIKHLIGSEVANAGSGHEATVVGYIELDEYVGLRLYQQRIVEMAYQAACDQIPVSIDS
jgi:hypothetical protein